MLKVVIFLQNAWSPLYAGGVWPRKSWLKALYRSRSGKRLQVLTDAMIGAAPEQWSLVWFDNTTPIVGDTPDSVVPADLGHIEKVIDQQKPDFIVGCGRQAADVLPAMRGETPLLLVPHPAHRLLTDELYREAGRILASGINGIIRLRQDRGAVICTSVSWR